jgi:predicted lactoylglutathione lyase
MEFFAALGFTFNRQFTDETAAAMVISDEIYAMLLTHEKFQGFTPKPIADAPERTEVLVALTCDSRSRGRRAGAQGGGGRGRDLQRAAKPRLHVRPRFPGPGRLYLGAGLHGTELYQ